MSSGDALPALPDETAVPYSSVAAIVLAAGMSRRMGRLKMLLPFGDRPMLGRTIENVQAAGNISPVIVITGHARQEIEAALVEYKEVLCIHNTNYDTGEMLSSVKAGVEALPVSCAAFFIVLGDQPTLRPQTLNSLRAAWHPEDAPIVVPAFQGKRGHPILIARRFRDEILGLGQDETLKTLMLRHAQRRREAPVDDPATITDVDTPEDYEAALAQWRQAKK